MMVARRLSAAVDGAPPGASRTLVSPGGVRLGYRLSDRVEAVLPGELRLAGGVRIAHLLPTAFDLSGLNDTQVEIDIEHTLGPSPGCEMTIARGARMLLWMSDGSPTRVPAPDFSLHEGVLCHEGLPVDPGWKETPGHLLWVARNCGDRLTCVLVAGS